ncbi:MAG: MBL fold metallo-hydrolase [Deltaproteobacteria bacterium]|nr:MBL fold metallo-hydrolase [Deltaproteobacteria bacterium]
MALLVLPSALFAYPGRRDARGGHVYRRTGRYHRHTKACRDREAAAAPPGSSGLRVARVARGADIPSSRPAPGTYRIHLIDVGTGLSILVQGADFTLLYDGGSRDDSRGLRRRGRTQSRLLAYLWRAIGSSVPRECTPDGDRDVNDATGEATIDYLILSHPHSDHVSMLDDVLSCYRVRDVWDAGVPVETVAYADFLEQVSAEPGVRYHTAAIPPRDLTFANLPPLTGPSLS